MSINDLVFGNDGGLPIHRFACPSSVRWFNVARRPTGELLGPTVHKDPRPRRIDCLVRVMVRCGLVGM